MAYWPFNQEKISNDVGGAALTCLYLLTVVSSL